MCTVIFVLNLKKLVQLRAIILILKLSIILMRTAASSYLLYFVVQFAFKHITAIEYLHNLKEELLPIWKKYLVRNHQKLMELNFLIER